MRRLLIAAIACLVLSAFAATGAAAAPNPNPTGHGQPSVTCGDPNALMEPAGFGTPGFANAEANYAGALGTPSAATGNLHVVSQYDVACFQVSSNH